MDHAVLLAFPAPTEATAEVIHRMPMRSISPSLSLRCKEKNFAAGTWMRCTLLSFEKPPRPVPWRTRAWPTWLSALDWRTSSEHSTSVRDNGFQNPVDVSSSRPRRYIDSDLEFSSCGPYRGVDSSFPVGG